MITVKNVCKDLDQYQKNLYSNLAVYFCVDPMRFSCSQLFVVWVSLGVEDLTWPNYNRSRVKVDLGLRVLSSVDGSWMVSGCGPRVLVLSPTSLFAGGLSWVVEVSGVWGSSSSSPGHCVSLTYSPVWSLMTRSPESVLPLVLLVNPREPVFTSRGKICK